MYYLSCVKINEKIGRDYLIPQNVKDWSFHKIYFSVTKIKGDSSYEKCRYFVNNRGIIFYMWNESLKLEEFSYKEFYDLWIQGSVYSDFVTRFGKCHIVAVSKFHAFLLQSFQIDTVGVDRWSIYQLTPNSEFREAEDGILIWTNDFYSDLKMKLRINRNKFFGQLAKYKLMGINV